MSDKSNITSFPQKENDPQQWYWFKEGLTPVEVERIIRLAGDLPTKKATTIGNEGENLVRSSMVKWIPQSDDWAWLYTKLKEWAQEANESTWDFDLYACNEQIQYTEYYASEKGHYDWHQDIGPGELPSKRKISITVQLSDADEYDGGELQISFGGTGVGELSSFNCPKGAGVSVLFPSYMMHRVSPVTRGTRRSLVLWVGGAHYR
tara:strand:+ start:1309 stop:1926 length:618 start_codon:yes stop_codon:yes gene_type:complete